MCVCHAQAVTEEQLSRAVKRLHMSSAESLNITDAGSLVAHELRLFDQGPAVALLLVRHVVLFEHTPTIAVQRQECLCTAPVVSVLDAVLYKDWDSLTRSLRGVEACLNKRTVSEASFLQ